MMLGKIRRLAAGFILSVLILFAATYAFAEIKYGNLKIIPDLTVSQVYSSNIYRNNTVAANGSPVNVRTDFITTTTPGLKLLYEFGGKHSFVLAGNSGINNYWHYTSNNYKDFNGNAVLNLRFTDLEANLGQTWQNSYLRRSNDDPTNRMRPYEALYSNASMTYKFADRWKIKPFHLRQDNAMKSDLDRSQSFVKNTSGLTLLYRLTGRIAALVEYSYVDKNFKFSDTSDHRDNVVYAGLSFDPEGKLKGDIKAGYAWVRYNHNVTERNNKPQLWALAGNLIYDFSSYTNAALYISRYHDDDIDSGGASFNRTMYSLTLQHLFTQKIGAMVMARYVQGDYLDKRMDNVANESKKRTDKQYDVGIGTFYDIQKWLQARLEYQYTAKNSNFEAYRYNENMVMFKIFATTP